jgi:predicted AAA+ superfamily ATPase
LSIGIGGLRRIGKTTLLKQLVGLLSANTISPKRICYFQFDRDLVRISGLVGLQSLSPETYCVIF